MSESAQSEHTECAPPEPTEQHVWLRQLEGDARPA